MSGNNYFKGWYFKCIGNDTTIAFIPSFHCSSGKETASLQIITDDAAFNIPFDSLEYSEKPLSVNLKNCHFSKDGIKLNIQSNNLLINGNIKFHGITPINYDIMGPFRFVPFMQCSHSVYSMRHKLEGEIVVNDRRFNFQNGIGYIEGDRGRSFPDKYIWTQCCFDEGSLMLSVADIPLLGFQFTGIIGVVLSGGKEYRIATYLGAKVRHIGDNTITVSQGGYELTAKLIEKKAQPLYAPINGVMNRIIHESASCKAYYKFSCKGKLLFEFTSDRASFEFEYKK
ncbi:MAG: hypothetical protein E7393_05285 [Ruminococcaceae bacterium]|nr:hypothetical protein [Oscillospiraceae bacterium]